MAEPSETLRRPLRRLVQFSLRGLLVLVAICSVWLGIAFHPARQQARAVAAIKSGGYSVRANSLAMHTKEGMRPPRQESGGQGVERGFLAL
jgi:hypothetical protein